MKVTYVKFIFERGSLILRRIKGYAVDDINQIITIAFEDKYACVMDMMYLISSMGKLKSWHDNLPHQEPTKVTINEED